MDRQLSGCHSAFFRSFETDYVEVITDGGAVSIKDINALRRDAIEKFEAEICNSFKREPKEIVYDKNYYLNEKSPCLSVEVRTKEQYEAVCNVEGIELFIPYNLYKEVKPLNAVCVLPPILKDSDEIDLSGIEKVEINNIGQLKLCKGKTVYAGYSMNIANSAASSALKNAGIKRICYSTELTLTETKNAFADGVDAEVMVYGRQRLMYMENCVIKSAYSCKCKESNFSLKDRMGVNFPIITENCRNIILNSRPTFMADKGTDIKNLQNNALRLIFTVENPKMCCIIIDEYKKMLNGEKVNGFTEEFTRGHFYRGAQ